MNKKLITFFSASGITANVARILSEELGADIYEIKAKETYTKKDLDWMDKTSRSSTEMHDKSYRPEISKDDANIKDYDVIFVGFPIWWYVAPTIINTFLESYDFSEKTVILFATSGGSGFGKTLEELKCSVSYTTTIKEGKLFKGKISKDEIISWAKTPEV